MSSAVVAHSLASLNDIADAPPANPPLQLQGEEPLVLYIARVPGSRDIFLTTMKPREKVVSAHDVESSLYYCHLTGDLDAELLNDSFNQDQPQTGYGKYDRLEDNLSNPWQPIHGRPLPALPPTLPTRPDPREWYPQTAQSTSMNGIRIQRDQHIRRKPIERLPLIIPPVVSQQAGSKQKILGPRSINQEHKTSPPKHAFPSPSYASNMQHRETPDMDKSQPLAPFHSSTYPGVDLSNGRHITLIRRDPGTRDQWNVSDISLDKNASPSSPSRSPKKRNRDVVMELSGSGYTKFQDTSHGSSAGFTSHLNLSSSQAGHEDDSWKASSNTPVMRRFSFTTPWRTSCTFTTTANGRVLKCYHALPETARTLSGGKLPSVLVSELRFNLPTLVENGVAKKKENRRPLSYSSKSLNRNSFSSLLPSRDITLLSNKPEWLVENNTNPRLPPRPVSYQDMSPIRPKLPPRPGNSFEGTYHQRSHSNDIDDNDFLDAELDLSLGQERAGGGFSGNKAKLGKLIIYGGQGLAMLDLLVSANMGVWFNDLLEN